MDNRYRRAWEARVMAGLSVAQVARTLGRSRSTIYSWERNTTPRQVDDLVALCRLYGICTDWYLEGRGPIWREDHHPPGLCPQLLRQLQQLCPQRQQALKVLLGGEDE